MQARPAVVDGAAGYLGKYRKMHIPDDPLYYEKYYFAPGDLGFKSWPTSKGDLGVLVCWDQWYPEAARATALQGADVLFYPTAIGWHPGEKASHGEAQREAWITMQRSHAVANGVFVVAVSGGSIPALLAPALLAAAAFQPGAAAGHGRGGGGGVLRRAAGGWFGSRRAASSLERLSD